ncbi:MAG: metallophosphoesterase family protein [Candidatus Rokuibacteriota bacterium]
MKIGVVSDTHGKLDPAVLRIFRGVDRIVHAGDIGRLEVIAGLEAIAPVLAVEGNNDHFRCFPEERMERLAGHRILVRHIVGELHQLRAADRARLAALRADVVLFGHSHRPYRARLGATLLFNPGSAGPRRFSLPRTVGLLWLEPDRIRTRIIGLD